MPICTKDFLLFLLAIVFLIVVGVSWFQDDAGNTGQKATVLHGLLDSFEDESVIYEAVLPEAKPDERNSRLKTLQGKIAQLFASGELTNQVRVPESETVPEIAAPSTNGEIILCPNYSKANPIWHSSNLKFVVTEGARILYSESGAGVDVDISSSAILQLPINSFPSGVKTCLNSDIVGIALEGSLMRNGEDKIYKIFGGETLLGYALDGFPIYGLDDRVVTDSCGGASVSGTYRYYLNSNRAGLIGCFSGSPISL